MANQNDIVGGGAEVAAVMVPLPAQSHLNQLLHLARLLAARNVTVYYTGAAINLRQVKLRLQGWDPLSVSNLHFHEFASPTFESPEPDLTTRYPAHIVPAFNAALLLREPLREFVSDLSRRTKRIIVIYDSMMAWNVQDLCDIQNVESYTLHAISAISIYCFHWLSLQKPPLPPEARVLEKLPEFDPFITPEVEEYLKFQKSALKFNSGTLFNTNRVIEPEFLDLLEKDSRAKTGRVWGIGPFNPINLPENQDSSDRHYCLSWLDKQEQSSVIFVSFGSTTSLSDEQINEIAIGLEKSNKKFIWVLRNADKANVFSGESRKAQLPERYEDRIDGRGLIARDWAPQLEILSHSSTGGFMSHCGWNSCMESISMGVPIAAWPMHSEQPWNATLITETLRIGVEVVGWDGEGVVSAERISEAVVRLMGSDEGDEMRRRAEKLGAAVRRSVVDGGDTCREIESFISHITRD